MPDFTSKIGQLIHEFGIVFELILVLFPYIHTGVNYRYLFSFQVTLVWSSCYCSGNVQLSGGR